MPIPAFAVLENRANIAVMARLSNAVAWYTPAVGQPKDVLVIFDADYQVVVDGMVATTGPVAVCSPLDIPSAKNRELLVIRGVTYEIVETMADSAGLTPLRLRVKV